MRVLAAGARLPGAARRRAATDYGGGTAPDSVRRANDQLTLVAFRIADDGSGRVDVTVATAVRLAASDGATSGRPPTARSRFTSAAALRA